MNFNDFSTQDGPRNGQKITQDDTKRVPKMRFFHVYFCLRFWTVLGSILARFWEPFGPQDRSKIGSKIIKKLSCGNIPPKDRSKRPQEHSKSPQEAPRPPKGASRTPQEAPQTLPRGSQEGPKTARDSSKWPQECPKMASVDIISLRKGLFDFSIAFHYFLLASTINSRQLSKVGQEAPKGFQ